MKKESEIRQSRGLRQLKAQIQSVIDDYGECSAVDLSVLEDLKYLLSEYIETGVMFDENAIYFPLSEDIYDDEMI